MKLQQSETQDFTILCDDVLQLLRKVKKVGDGWTALCPSHNDHRNSLSIGKALTDGKALLHCHAGCSYEDIVKALGLWKDVDLNNPKTFNIVNEYDYVDENGEVVFQVVRLSPKGFAQRRLDKNGNWTYNLKGVVRVLYNLPTLLSSETIFIVEGEKDADKLTKLGLASTTNSGGAGKWLKEYNKYFKDKIVILIPDNDPVGYHHMEEVSKGIYPIAKSVKILKLDGLQEKQDLSDWLKKNGLDELNQLISDTPEVKYEESELNFDETLPSNVEAEMAILGAILKDGRLIKKAIDVDLIKDFHFPKNKKILKSMLTLFDEKEKIDYITVSENLKKNNQLDSVGGVTFLKDLKEQAPDAINFDSWVKVVTSKADLRRLIDISKKVSKTAYGEFDDAKNIGTEVAQELLKLRRNSKKQDFKFLGTEVDSVLAKIRSLDGTRVIGLPTGFVEIDTKTSGLQKTDLILVAGRPSMGKSVLAVNLATNAALSGANVLFFSLEMSTEQVIQRVIASEARVNLQALRTNNLDHHSWARIANTLPLVEEAGIFIDDTAAISVTELRSKIYSYIDEHGMPDLVIIDYVQLMAGSGRETRQQEVSQISRELKGLAKELNVPIVAVSQLSRAPEGRNDPRPKMSDLRESGSLEQDADVIIFVFREEYYNPTDLNKGMAEIIFAKQRNGPTGTVNLAFLDSFVRFENMFEKELKL